MTQWTLGPSIQVLEAENPNGSWIVSAVGSGSGRCPNCESLSTSRHSRYVRHLQDLPVQGTTVALRLKLSRWRCRNRGCERQTFSDLLPRIARPFARRTRRVSELAHLVGHAAGGRPAERLMARLGLPQSDDTILRQLKRHQTERGEATAVRVVGIDDWSWRKGSSYGTIVVDLERREVVDVLADRSAEGTAQWFDQHPGVEIVSRDRCGLYAEGTRRGAPEARQVGRPLPSAPEPAPDNRAAAEPCPPAFQAGGDRGCQHRSSRGSQERRPRVAIGVDGAPAARSRRPLRCPEENVRPCQSPASCGQRDPGDRA
jgi:transposase